MWRRGRDWWRLWTESRAVCATAPVETPLGPPSGDTPGAGSGAGETSGETDIPAPAAEPSAEAPVTASADAPFSPPAEYTSGWPLRRRSRYLERHLRERRWIVQRAPSAVVERRWPVSRSGSAFQRRQCHPATPEYRPLCAEPGPLPPRPQVSGSAPAARIPVAAEPARLLRWRRASCPAPAARIRLRAEPVRALRPRVTRRTAVLPRCTIPLEAAVHHSVHLAAVIGRFRMLDAGSLK